MPGPCASRMMVPSSMFQSTSRVDLLQLAVRRKRLDPAAQIAERGRASFNGHLFFPGLEHGLVSSIAEFGAVVCRPYGLP